MTDGMLYACFVSFFVAELMRRLASRRVFVPWGAKASDVAAAMPKPKALTSMESEHIELPEGVEDLVLWTPGERASEGAAGTSGEEPHPDAKPVVVDRMLTRWLRPHQREGVKFMFECVMGLRDFDGTGCILADDMGLGKTLQGITLLWTLLQQGLDGSPAVKRALIVCPTSLVSNWDDECNKWLKGRVKTLPICDSTRAEVVSSVKSFLAPRHLAQVMIVSYETFRIHSSRFNFDGAVDLIMCDEAHRLKNGETLTNKALCSVPCLRRVMLSGTPMQNHLDEFYSMVGFCNPGLLGTPAEFAKKYERPILAGREPDCTELEMEKAQAANTELSDLVNKFILRRTNTILSKHLPPKVVEVVCCKLSPLQQALYEHFLSSKAATQALTGKATAVLPAITALKKLCNHPKLIYDMIKGAKNTGNAAAGFATCAEFFTPGMYDSGSGRSGRGGGGMMHGWENHSGKFAVLGRLLANLRAETKDRIVIISNYTQTLDLIAHMCRERNYPHVRLDGSTSIGKRQKLVKAFNDPTSNSFVFLLSSKAGGCGINLIGGNRLVLFDPDWNPANDKQAAARCWRDGQKKKCYLYRFLASGTIEEKVFQRQLSKESLQNVVNGSGELEQSVMSKDELRKLFSLDCTTSSDTHDTCGCKRCPKCEDAKELGLDADDEFKVWEEQIDEADEQKLDEWAHHHRVDKVPDDMMKKSAGEDVSFVFSLKVEGCAIADNKKTENKKESEGSNSRNEGASKPASGAPPARTFNNPARAPPARPPMAASAAQKPATKFVPPSRRPLTVMNAPGKSAYQKPTIAAKPPTKKPKAAPKRKKAIESESEEESDAATSESEEESEEESEADDDAVPDSEEDDDDDENDENVSAGTKRPPAKTDARPTRQKSARLSSLTSGVGIGIPALSSDEEDDEDEDEDESDSF